MGRGRQIWERLAEGADLGTESPPGEPVVEIAGTHRVLIENHLGVREYTCERITVRVRFGWVCVCGCELRLLRMTKEQLVVGGRIDAVTLRR